MDNEISWLIGLFMIGMVVVLAWILGNSHGHLARMELVAAVHTAKTEVGWTYERYRLESLRMDWLALAPQARAEYSRSWGRPRWAFPSKDGHDPMGEVAKVRGGK